MELLETRDPKSELLKKSARQREALEEEVKFLSERTQRIITNAVVVGGALALTYWVVTRFAGKGKAKTKVRKRERASGEPVYVEVEGDESKVASVLSSVGTVLATQATAFLLALAKEKLMEYLATQSDKEKDTK